MKRREQILAFDAGNKKLLLDYNHKSDCRELSKNQHDGILELISEFDAGNVFQTKKLLISSVRSTHDLKVIRIKYRWLNEMHKT